MKATELSSNQSKHPQANPLFLLDYQSGLARAVDDRDLYTRLLAVFRERFSGINIRVSTLINEGKLIEARRLLHDMKGSAATISADLLSQKSAELEKSIKQGGIPVEIKPFTETLEKTLQQIENYMNNPQ